MNKIKKLRIQSGLTQKKLANSLGVTQAAVCMWEAGKRFPHAAGLLELARALNCTTDELFTAEDSESA